MFFCLNIQKEKIIDAKQINPSAQKDYIFFWVLMDWVCLFAWGLE